MFLLYFGTLTKIEISHKNSAGCKIEFMSKQSYSLAYVWMKAFNKCDSH